MALSVSAPVEIMHMHSRFEMSVYQLLLVTRAVLRTVVLMHVPGLEANLPSGHRYHTVYC